jgi:type I restriction enzyme S subunit
MINEDWCQIKLADLCDSIDYGYTAAASTIPVGAKFLRITDIVNGYINWNEVPFCDVDRWTKEKYRLSQGDIVIARTGATTGVSAFIADPPDAIFASYLVRLKINKRTDARFISYFLKSPEFWDYIHGVLGDKSAQPNASAKTMTQVLLRLPPLSEQLAIAHILSTLDDKIELNHHMNETLEAIARAIFKSWFVDFDPVKAKAEGRKPEGMDDDITALFPSKFTESSFGLIPEGWEVTTVEEIAQHVAMGPFGSSIKVSTFVNKGIPVISGQQMPCRKLCTKGEVVKEHRQNR